jgi:hypothetical protein
MLANAASKPSVNFVSVTDQVGEQVRPLVEVG